MLLTLASADPRPRNLQIVSRIQEMIRAGHLAVGDALPSTRQLAQQLGLHRSTVARSYQTLWSLGWVDLHPGVPPRVRARATLAPLPRTGGFDWAERLGERIPGLDRPARSAPVPGQISFTLLGLDPRLMPMEPFGRCLKAALRRQGSALMQYGDPQGSAELRACLTRRMGQHGIGTEPGELLITHGAQQALDLTLRALTRPGDSVVVEAPTYDRMLDLLALHGLRPLPVPAAAFDAQALERLLEREHPALLYTMPSFQNPTGRSLDQASREALLQVCGRHRVPILEDGFEEEMAYFGRPVLPIKSMDSRGLVLYAGTFSKILMPGLRIGWLAAPPACIRALTGLRRSTELCPAPLLQAALAEFMQTGHYDRHLARVHRRFRRRMETALGALKRELDPDQVRWSAPAGGFLLWLELAAPVPEAELAARLSAFGLRIPLGRPFYSQPGAPTGLRLSIASLDEEEIRTGIARLGQALRSLAGAGR